MAQRPVIENNLTARGRVNPGDGVEDRRLARPIRADDRIDRVWLDLQIEAVDGGQATETHGQLA